MIIKEHDRIQHHAGKGFLNKIIYITFRENYTFLNSLIWTTQGLTRALIEDIEICDNMNSAIWFKIKINRLVSIFKNFPKPVITFEGGGSLHVLCSIDFTKNNVLHFWKIFLCIRTWIKISWKLTIQNYCGNLN